MNVYRSSQREQTVGSSKKDGLKHSGEEPVDTKDNPELWVEVEIYCCLDTDLDE